jgi:LmbE family N-acetylglucosaminyl deacetylase
MPRPDVAALLSGPGLRRLDRLDWPAGLSVAVLGPHPDDFDCVAVTLRHLTDRGARLHVAVLSAGVSGVEDSFGDAAQKAAVRRAEQQASCRQFGLPADALTFLPLAEDAAGEPADTPANRDLVAAWLQPIEPALVFLPHGHDQKGGHRNVAALFRGIAIAERLSITGMLNRDPKTIALRFDAAMPYGEQQAAWKAALLRCHDTQQQRNLHTRGHGFDDRILATDRRSAQELGLDQPYAEAFEVAAFHEGVAV